ncbi:hypothetical protein D3C87_1184390 [compost metagenome]
MFDFRPQFMHRCVVDIADPQHGMGVAHGHGGQIDRGAVDVDLITLGLLRRLERNIRRHQAWGAHVDTDLAVVTHVELDDTALGLDADLPLCGQALVEHETGEAARTVAALFHFGTVGVEDPIAEIHVRVARCFDDQQLVETDSRMPITPQLGVLGQNMRVLADQVEDHEVIAQAVHLGKTQQHGFTPAAGFRQQTTRLPFHGDALQMPDHRPPTLLRYGRGCCSWNS